MRIIRSRRLLRGSNDDTCKAPGTVPGTEQGLTKGYCYILSVAIGTHPLRWRDMFHRNFMFSALTSDFCFKGRKYPYPTQLRMYACTCILEALFHCPAAFVEHLLCVWLAGRERGVGGCLYREQWTDFFPIPETFLHHWAARHRPENPLKNVASLNQESAPFHRGAN